MSAPAHPVAGIDLSGRTTGITAIAIARVEGRRLRADGHGAAGRHRLPGHPPGAPPGFERAALPAEATRDALDAIAAALAAARIAGGTALSVGNADEGLIWFAPEPVAAAEHRSRQPGAG